MQQARDTIESLLLKKQARSAFEDYDLFASYLKVLGDDITDIGQKLIEHGITLCGNFVIEDGLSDFEKKNFEHCANVFRLSSMKDWKK
ncbi:hypothetical protein V5799_030909 [Amblyomma americanum]|uniref:Uncharacterized protein n=1 Tax=Amblyomma americanum TaxID=6943 RepID=A0AAQ4EM11_AMBAM